MLCSVALFNPTVDLSNLLQLLICHGVSVEKSTERRQAVDRFLLEGLTVDACDHVGAVCCALHGVAVDPSCLAGADVRGEAEAGGVALSHGVVCCLGLVYRQGGQQRPPWCAVQRSTIMAFISSASMATLSHATPHQCHRDSVRSAPASCSARTSPKGSRHHRRTRHMP